MKYERLQMEVVTPENMTREEKILKIVEDVKTLSREEQEKVIAFVQELIKERDNG